MKKLFLIFFVALVLVACGESGAIAPSQQEADVASQDDSLSEDSEGEDLSCSSHADCRAKGYKFCSMSGTCVEPMEEEAAAVPQSESDVTEQDSGSHSANDVMESKDLGAEDTAVSDVSDDSEEADQEADSSSDECLVDSDCPPAEATCHDGSWLKSVWYECDDGDCEKKQELEECTHGCEDGACLSASDPCEGMDCDDDNPCTEDSCEGGGCVHMAVADYAACADSSICLDGICTVVECDDGNPCTEDTLNQSGQCSHEVISGCCLDDDDCDDGNPCTTDSCEGGECITQDLPDHVLVQGACPSGPEGSYGYCLEGQCVVLDCDDGDPCTEDHAGCYLKGGHCFCSHVQTCCSLDEQCDDGKPCTEDSCVDGMCQHEDLCLYRYCGPGSWFGYGCGEPITMECSAAADCEGTGFGDFCLFSEQAGMHVCQECHVSPDGVTQTCPEGMVCLSETSETDIGPVDQNFCQEVVCETDSDCDDGDPCTEDSCVEGMACENSLIENCQACLDDADCSSGAECLSNGTVEIFSGSCVDGLCESQVSEEPGDLAYHCGAADELACRFLGEPPYSDARAIIWFGADQEEEVELNTGIFMLSVETLCLWGEPSFKFNLSNGGNTWGGTSGIEVVCQLGGQPIEIETTVEVGDRVLVEIPEIACFE